MSFWWSASPPAWSLALAPLELAYRARAAVHRISVRRAHARVPVISVGNLTVGGAGKTPVAIEIGLRLATRGLRPAVLSRGYGRLMRAPMQVSFESRVDEVGDEPLLMARRGLTVFVGPRRALLADMAVQRGADVVILDDGLQHHALARDLDVVVVDASNAFGNGRLLPRGPLREVLSALRRVQRGLLWFTRSDLPRDARTASLPPWPAVESSYAAREDLRRKRVFLFAGIARPASFEATVRGLGAEIAGARWFGDHHRYGASDLAALRRDAGDAMLVTTEKDLVRIDQPHGIVAVRVDVRIHAGEDALDAALKAVL
ncbi:MAG: tetraacyldisaccharide 4'-kinase [Myxococcales bacterium]